MRRLEGVDRRNEKNLILGISRKQGMEVKRARNFENKFDMRKGTGDFFL